jgi:hypothetical protein
MAENESVQVVLGETIIVMTFRPFDLDIDIDHLTSIDHSNLYGEMVTVSALLNKVGILKAEFENEVEKLKLEIEVESAQIRKRTRQAAVDSGTKLNLQQIDDSVLLNVGYQNKFKAWLIVKKTRDIVDSFYWGVQSKDKKLSVLMKPIVPEEFAAGIVEGVVNQMMIKKVVL